MSDFGLLAAWMLATLCRRTRDRENGNAGARVRQAMLRELESRLDTL